MTRATHDDRGRRARRPLRCRLGLHRWVLWPEPLRRDAGEAPWVCARCGAEPRVP